MIQYSRIIKSEKYAVMHDYFRKTLFATFLITSAILFQSHVVFAQTIEGLQLKPAVIEDNVKPGDVYRFSITVNNIGSVEKTFYLTTQDIKGLDDEGLPVFSTAGEVTGYELSSWVTLPLEPLTLKSGESSAITVVARVPANASPGAHFAGIFFSDHPSKPDANGSSIGLSVGSIMSLTIAGAVRDEAKLREFSTGKVVYGTASVDFNTKIQNLGNILVRPHGLIEISNMFGKKVASVEVNSSVAPVFPASERIYRTVWISDAFSFGRYEAVGSFSYGDQEKKTVSGTTSFWILPLMPIALVLGVLLSIVVGMYLAIKLYIRKKLREMGIAKSGNADMNFYAKKYQQSGSRLIMLTLFIFLFCVAFLGVLFLIFA